MEGQLDIATQDYEYLNGLLKEELPRILQLQSQLVDPMFQNLYFIQCRIYAMLLARMQEVISTNGAYFQTLNMGVEEGFNERSRQFNPRSELEESGLLKQGGRAWLGGQCNGYVASFRCYFGSHFLFFSICRQLVTPDAKGAGCH